MDGGGPWWRLALCVGAQDLRAAIAAAPSYLDAYVALAQLYVARGRPVEALMAACEGIGADRASSVSTSVSVGGGSPGRPLGPRCTALSGRPPFPCIACLPGMPCAGGEPITRCSLLVACFLCARAFLLPPPTLPGLSCTVGIEGSCALQPGSGSTCSGGGCTNQWEGERGARSCFHHRRCGNPVWPAAGAVHPGVTDGLNFDRALACAEHCMLFAAWVFV